MIDNNSSVIKLNRLFSFSGIDNSPMLDIRLYTHKSNNIAQGSYAIQQHKSFGGKQQQQKEPLQQIQQLHKVLKFGRGEIR